MNRWMLPILLCSAVHSAPQDSDITYVKIQPLNIDRESRDDTPVTNLPQNASQSEFKEPEEKTDQPASSTSKIDLTSLDPSEPIDPSIISKLNRISTDDPSRPNQTKPDQTESLSENAYRYVRSDATVNYETTTDVVTETENVPETVKFETRTRAPLRYLSKLSYYKSTVGYGGSDVNLLERGGKRRFRSKCRCEKIWNCPKLQITVPRCPDEYFLCCF